MSQQGDFGEGYGVGFGGGVDKGGQSRNFGNVIVDNQNVFDRERVNSFGGGNSRQQDSKLLNADYNLNSKEFWADPKSLSQTKDLGTITINTMDLSQKLPPTPSVPAPNQQMPEPRSRTPSRPLIADPAQTKYDKSETDYKLGTSNWTMGNGNDQPEPSNFDKILGMLNNPLPVSNKYELNMKILGDPTKDTLFSQNQAKGGLGLDSSFLATLGKGTDQQAGELPSRSRDPSPGKDFTLKDLDPSSLSNLGLGRSDLNTPNKFGDGREKSGLATFNLDPMSLNFPSSRPANNSTIFNPGATLPPLSDTPGFTSSLSPFKESPLRLDYVGQGTTPPSNLYPPPMPQVDSLGGHGNFKLQPLMPSQNDPLSKIGNYSGGGGQSSALDDFTNRLGGGTVGGAGFTSPSKIDTTYGGSGARAPYDPSNNFLGPSTTSLLQGASASPLKDMTIPFSSPSKRVDLASLGNTFGDQKRLGSAGTFDVEKELLRGQADVGSGLVDRLKRDGGFPTGFDLGEARNRLGFAGGATSAGGGTFGADAGDIFGKDSFRGAGNTGGGISAFTGRDFKNSQGGGYLDLENQTKMTPEDLESKFKGLKVENDDTKIELPRLPNDDANTGVYRLAEFESRGGTSMGAASKM